MTQRVKVLAMQERRRGDTPEDTWSVFRTHVKAGGLACKMRSRDRPFHRSSQPSSLMHTSTKPLETLPKQSQRQGPTMEDVIQAPHAKHEYQ